MVSLDTWSGIMTIIFERRQINDKILIVQFQFDSYNVKGSGGHVDGYSLDKYFALDTWAQIYTKLDASLEKYKANMGSRLKSETIQMHRSQLDLRLSWRNKQPFHREIMNQESKNCDLCPFVLVVKIGMFSQLDKLKKQLSQEKLVKEKSQSNSKTDQSGCSTPINVEEYVPTPLTTVNNSLKYTPSSVSSARNSGNSDEYTPIKCIESDPEIITYTPTKIDENKSHKVQTNKNKSTAKIDFNRNDCPDKKNRNDTPKIDDLFGGDSDDNAERKGRANLRSSSKKTTHTESSKVLGTPKQQQNLDDWVNRTRPRKNQPTIVGNGVSDDTQKKRRINEISPIELSNEKHSKNKQTDKDKQAEESRKLRALREEYEEMERNVVIDQILNLKDMSISDILNTFSKHEKVLRERFKMMACTPDHQINPVRDECDFPLILDGLISEEQQQKMYFKLRESFCKNVPKDAITSNHENLLWKILLPEWALHIFCSHFVLTKDEAILRLRQQDQFNLQVQDDTLNFNLDY